MEPSASVVILGEPKAEPVTVWQLKHSAYQLIAMASGQLRFSTRLAKRDLSAAAASIGDPLSTEYLLCSLPVMEIRSVRVNHTRRSIRIATGDNEVEAIGFDPKTPSLSSRLGGIDKHDPKNPTSPTGDFGATIARAAGLELRGDQRAAILHYVQSTAGESRFTIDSGRQTCVVRPWTVPLRIALVLGWMTGTLVLFSGISLSASSRPLLRVGLPMLVLAVGLVGATAGLLGGVRIDEQGLHLPGILRRRHISWTEVDLIHSVDSGDMFIARPIRVVCRTGRDVSLPMLTRRQADVVSEALVRYGVPHGVYSSVFVGDFGRPVPIGTLTKSPINDGSRI